MFGQSLLSAFGIACTTDTDQLFNPTSTQINSLATYQLNNATTSIPSNTYPGTPSNITYTTGKFGDAAVFNGSNTGINIGASNNFASNKLTISFWANPGTANPSNYQLLFSNYIGGSLADYDFIINRQSPNHASNAEKLEVGISGSGSAYLYILTDSAVFTPGTWKNYVIVFDTTESANVDKVKIYVNGTLKARSDVSSSGNVTGSLLDVSDDLLIGTWPHDTSHRYSGIMDQVRIFNSALPQTAVTALYNETTTTAQNAYITEEVYSGIAYYKMADATDQLGNYNGTATNVNFNTEGKFGFAGAFNGSSSYIQLPNNSLNYLTSYTVSSWVYPKSSTNGGVIFQNWGYVNGQAEKGWIISKNSNDNKIKVNNYNGGATQTYLSTAALSLNTWTNVVISNTQTEIKIYINGSLDSTHSSSGFVVDSGYPHKPGISFYQYSGGTFGYFDGNIDQVRIYDSAISAANVSTLYKEVECEPAAINALANFNTVLYSGNSNTQSITGVGFETNFTWIKRRDGSENHYLQDSVRGSTKQIYSNLNSAEYNETSAVTSFDSDGFTMGSYNGINNSGETYVAWNFKAGGTAVSNTDGTITSQVSANTEAGFSIVQWTSPSGNGNPSNVGHGLSKAPELIFYKGINYADNWYVYSQPTGLNKYLNLNTNGALVSNNSNGFTNVNSSTFTTNLVNGSNNILSYCFTSIPGYSRVGSYNGTGASGNNIYVGFEPGFVMVKRTDAARSWMIFDSVRGASKELYPDLADQEYGAGGNVINSNGFAPEGGGGQNILNGNYIYLAIA
jgi:hypothetical protein